jgi:teichuronic acid exporter
MSSEIERPAIVTTSAQVLHALRWNALVRAGAQAATWLITIFVMRLLTPADYGLLNLATILVGLCALVNELGAVPALIQRQEIEEPLVQKIFGLVLTSNAVLYAITFLGAPYFAAFFGEERLILIIRVLALDLLITAFSAIPSVLLQRELEFKSISLIEFGATIAGSLSTLVLAVEGFGVWALVSGTMVKSVCNTGGLLAITRFRIVPLFNFMGLKAIFAFGMKVSGARIVWYFNSVFDGLLVGKALGEHALGLYSVADTLALLPVSKLLGLTNQIAFAAYSRLQHDRARVTKYFLDTAALASFIFFPIAWGMSAVAEDFVEVILGSTWHEAAVVLQIIALGVPYRALGRLIHPLVDGLGQPGVGLKNTLTTSLIVPAAAVAGLYWGLIGLCIASLLGVLLSATFNLRRSLAVLETKYGQLVSAFLPSMVAAGIMCAVVLIAKLTLFSQTPSLWRLPLLVALGALVYGIVSVCFNRYPAVRWLQLIRSGFG